MSTTETSVISAGMSYWSRGSHGEVVCCRRKWPVR